MELKAVAIEVAARASTTGLRGHDHPVSPITPPVFIVTYPDTIVFDETYGRGQDSMTLGLWVAVGDVNGKSARDALSDYTAGAGAKSLKAALEGPGACAAFDDLHVTDVKFDPVTIGATTYMGAMFTLEITGDGSP